MSDQVLESADRSGQRSTADNRSGRPPTADDRSSQGTDRDWIRTLQRVAFGSIAAGLLAAVAGLLAGAEAVSIVLGGASLVGLGFWLVARRWQRVRRPGAIGTSIGLALVTALWTVVPTARSPFLFVVAGIVGYVVLAESDRLRCERASSDQEFLAGSESAHSADVR